MALRVGGEANIMALGDHGLGPRGPQRKPRSQGRVSGDSVEISDAAKKLNEENAASGGVREGSGQDQDLVSLRAKIQERIASGFYNSEEVLKEVARKVLDVIGY
jgi:hypothetical protein